LSALFLLYALWETGDAKAGLASFSPVSVGLKFFRGVMILSHTCTGRYRCERSECISR